MKSSISTWTRYVWLCGSLVLLAIVPIGCQSQMTGAGGGQRRVPMGQHVKVKNTSGKTASDLHITFRGSGGSLQIDPASVRPGDGNKAPKVPWNDKSPTNEGVIEWSKPTVKNGDDIDFDVATDFGPLEFESGFWTGPTDNGPREKIGPVTKGDVEITNK